MALVEKKELVDFLGTNSLTRAVLSKLTPSLVDTGVEAIKFDLECLDAVKRYWQPNSLMVIVANHQSHADLVVFLKIVRELRTRVPILGNFYIPISSSLESGKQGGIGQTLYSEMAKPIFEQNRIKPIYVITENDIQKRGQTLTLSQARLQHKMIEVAVKESNSAFLVFAEGTVQGGRHDQGGNIYGIQEVNNRFFETVVNFSKKNQKKAVFVPVGISGTYKLLSAEHIFLTFESAKTLFARLLRKRIVLADAKVGTPFIINPQTPPEEINDLVMRRHLASLLPEGARGFYKESSSNNIFTSQAYL